MYDVYFLIFFYIDSLYIVYDDSWVVYLLMFCILNSDILNF